MNEDNPRPRVVFDCMVYLQATASESGPAAALLRLVDSDALFLFVSEEILEEVRDVLSRPKIRERNLNITDERVDALINRLLEKATVISKIQQHFIYRRDPKDEKYINLAIEEEVDYLISRDKDLLELMTGMTFECKDFRRRFRRLKIIEPVEFLKIAMLKEADKPTE